jgi:hypothetical protein
MNRREFLRQSALAAAAMHQARPSVTCIAPEAPVFTTANRRWQAAYDRALTVLAGNIRVLPKIAAPVLIEGAEYAGIWMECGPLEALVYRKFRPDVARASHMTFFTLQREDGQLPANNKLSETGFGQIQMVVPIAATAWELAQATGDEELLRTAYRSCSAWDAWLVRYRNSRGTGLTEGFCTYDTGMDNSPRWAGIPSQCPGKDAKRMPPVATLPRLCPDLSATTYGARVALAAMANALGKAGEAALWSEKAQAIRSTILARLYSAEDAAFYDLDAQDRFVKIRSCVLTRLCGEHVPDQRLFDDLWKRQLADPKAFWAPFPLPSVALDDPLFVRPIPRNSWGGAAQALTALRAGRWFDHYGRAAEFSTMMEQWCEAIQRDMSFRQQIDPLTGEFTQAASAGYSPCALVLFDYTWRLGGIHEEHDVLHWNVRPGHAATEQARFSMRLDTRETATLAYAAHGARLQVGCNQVAAVEGGAVRVVTDKRGTPLQLWGIHPQPQKLVLRVPGHPARSLRVKANVQVSL